jgi:hypothetical protein
MLSDKELIRQGRYQEALGENFDYKPIYVMLFDDGECLEHLDICFYTIKEAKEWLEENKKPLEEKQEWHFGNKNADWL